MNNPRIGWLVVNSSKRDGNVGGLVIKRSLLGNGYHVENCGPGNINNYHIVLLSLPSNYHILEYLKCAIANRLDRRGCIIIAGGFGAQNIRSIEDYLDFVYYGRAHNDITNVINDIWTHGDTDNQHTYKSHSNRVAIVNHDSPLYKDSAIKEEFSGCKNMCKFCHYAHARSMQGDANNHYIQNMLTGGKSPEMLLVDIPNLKAKPGRIRTAIDGSSERLRLKFGKRIMNTDIVRAVNHLGSMKDSRSVTQLGLFGSHSVIAKKETVVAMTYNIGHMPTETNMDVEELHETLRACSPKERVIIIVHVTPFRPSLLTPMQWMPVRIFPQWSDRREEVIVDRKNLLAKYSFTLEGAYQHLASVVIDRYGIHGDDQPVLDLILRPKGTKSKDKATYLYEHGGAKYTAALNIDSTDPIPNVVSFFSKGKLKALAKRLS